MTPKPHAQGLPEGYADWLSQFKTEIHLARQHTALAVNAELAWLYQGIGQEIPHLPAKPACRKKQGGYPARGGHTLRFTHRQQHV